LTLCEETDRQTDTTITILCPPIKIGKERKSIYITPFIYYVYLKVLWHGSHSFTCKLHQLLRKRSPDGATPEVTDI